MDQKLSIAQAGITDYLIIRWRKVSDPATEIGRQVLAPVVPTNNNIVVVGLDPDYYFFDVFESVDGSTLSSLLNTFEINVADGSIKTEFRYYQVDRGNPGDPTDSTANLDDSYLDGKTVSRVSQRAQDFLIPTTEWTRTSTGILLTAPLLFSHADWYELQLDYQIPGTPPSSTGTSFGSEVDITGNVTLDSSYIGKLINCNSAGTRLKITLDHVESVPGDSQYKFIDQEGGSQLQTIIVPQDGTPIKWRGMNMSEIWIGKGEYIILKKRGTYWKVVDCSAGLNLVGLIPAGNTLAGTPNTLAEDGALRSGDDFPRMWYWIVNTLDASDKYIDDALDGGGYVRDPNKIGQFIYSTTKKKFLMPNSQDMVLKGLKSFSTHGVDTSRVYDYPGGLQLGQVGAFSGTISFPAIDTSQHDGGGPLIATGIGGNAAAINLANATFNTGKENIVKNLGVIFYRFI